MKYFDNNWDEYNEAPDEFFHDHTYEDVMQWKVGGWEFPSSVFCVIRETNLKKNKVKEYVYRRPHAARAKVTELLQLEDTELTIADHDSIICLRKSNLEEFGINVEDLNDIWNDDD